MTEKEIATQLRACYDRMDAAKALLEQAEADEAVLGAEIEKRGYDAGMLIEQAYSLEPLTT